jgi:competence ComEA-like helix-hairpin-helix protein
LNVSTVAMEELQSLMGIGEKAAQKIIKWRKEKGAYLTLEDLKMMTDIPSIIWDQLIKDGIIAIKLSDETPVHQTMLPQLRLEMQTRLIKWWSKYSRYRKML